MPRPPELRLEPLAEPAGRGDADLLAQALAAWRQQHPEPKEPVIEL